MSERIGVVTSADAGFLRPLAVLLKSLSSQPDSDRIDVTVLTDGSLPSDLASRIEGELRISYQQVAVPERYGTRLPPYLTVPTLYRLFLGDVLPDSHRVIFLDADTLVRQPLSGLWDVDLAGSVIGAVRDPLVPFAGSPLGLPWRSVGVRPDQPYFNAGVMLVDLDRWRSLDLGSKALESLEIHRVNHGDQCALNSVAQNWVSLAPAWNLQAGHFDAAHRLAWVTENTSELDAALTNPAVVHFNTSALGRPWQEGCSHRFATEWRAVLKSMRSMDQQLAKRPKRPLRVRPRRTASALIGS